MIFSIVQTTLLSIIFIVTVHYIYIFFKENLTTPKIRDLVNKPAEQYDKIYKDLEKEPTATAVDMKGELQSYLKSLSNKKEPETVKKPEDFSFQNDGGSLQYQSL
jgi:hypothetical protein|tara:strand:- start:153 stop:467 length:315 start_codon:yes stop_codon:yes gene_type:complete